MDEAGLAQVLDDFEQHAGHVLDRTPILLGGDHAVVPGLFQLFLERPPVGTGHPVHQHAFRVQVAEPEVRPAVNVAQIRVFSRRRVDRLVIFKFPGDLALHGGAVGFADQPPTVAGGEAEGRALGALFPIAFPLQAGEVERGVAERIEPAGGGDIDGLGGAEQRGRGRVRGGARGRILRHRQTEGLLPDLGAQGGHLRPLRKLGMV